MEPESSLPHSQVPATCVYPENLNLLPPKRNSAVRHFIYAMLEAFLSQN